MLLARMGGRDWTTELPIRMPDAVVPAQPIADLSNARLGLVTTGGLVPRGNPDGLVRGGFHGVPAVLNRRDRLPFGG